MIIDINEQEKMGDKDLNGDEKFVQEINLNERPIIEVRNVHKTYLLGLEGVTALRGIPNNYFRGIVHNTK